MTHGHFESTFSKYAYGRGEGVTKKSALCTLVKMMTIMDDPLGNNVLEYQEKVKYLGVLLNDKLNDNDDIMKQMRGLCARANSVLRKFAACSFEVQLRLF